MLNPRLLLSILFFVFAQFLTTQAQIWNNVGVPGFSAGVVSYTSIATDGSGTPYVAFVDAANGQRATVMKYNGSSWVTVGIEGFSAGIAVYTSIAIDGSGTPYVAYEDVANSQKATVMKYSGGSWVTVGTAGFSAGEAQFTSLAIDGSGTPYVVYEGDAAGYASVMKYDGGSWVTVGSTGFSASDAQYTSIAIDASGTPYVVYQDFGSSQKATVMKYNGSSWVTVGSAGFSAGIANNTSIALDVSGAPYVAYSDVASSLHGATVMKYNGSSWVTVGTAGFTAGFANHTSIAMDGSGTPYVVYEDFGTSLKSTVMKYNGSSWVAAGPAGFSAGPVGFTSIAISAAGIPYVVYEDYGYTSKATVMKLTPGPPVSPITGITNICVGAATTLTDTTAGGTWSSSNTSVATVGSTGILTGVAPGTATISYTLAGGSAATISITVNALPAGISGVASIYVGGTTTLSDPTAGGTWSSSSTGVATISGTGIVRGVSVGVTTIRYTVPSGCTASLLVSVTSPCSGNIITTVAGSGPGGYGWGGFGGDGAQATMAQLNYPNGTASDAAGNLYVADYINNRIRKIDPSGIITTLAGTGTMGFYGDGGAATAAFLNLPVSVATDGAGNVYFVDGNVRVRKVNNAGIITTFAGTGTATYGGDNIPATASGMGPLAVATDITGNVYISDAANSRIRKVNTSGIVTTIAGTFTSGYTGDGGPATAAQISSDAGLAADGSGNIYFADNLTDHIRKIDAAGIITTIAGTGTPGFSGDDGPSTAAQLNGPAGIGSDPSGNVYICDEDRIRKINTAGIITTIAGNGTLGFSGDGSPAITATFRGSNAVSADGSGNVYVSDIFNYRVRKIGANSNHTPHFTNGHSQILTVCENATATAINSLLAVNDTDAGQTEIWGVLPAPAHGTVVATYTTTSTGSVLTPTGLTYIPATGYSGADSFGVSVVDCNGAADFTTIHITISSLTAITGAATLCRNTSVTLMDSTTGGSWSTSPVGIATIGSSTGIVTGVAGGVATITYSLGSGCSVTKTLTVNPIAAITGITAVCVGATTTLSDLATGGTWSSSTPAIATITGTGLIRGISSGTSVITYTTTAGCTATTTVSVNSGPSIITGNLSVCIGTTAPLADSTAGGTWTSSNTSVATIVTGTGVATGVSPGTSVITYSLGGSCTVTATVTVDLSPSPVSGVPVMCESSTTSLSDAGGSGSWSSSNITTATVSATGVVTGITAGIATITYTPGIGCFAVKTVTVNSIPSPVFGTAGVCVGLTTTLSDTTAGGRWSTSAMAIATIGSLSGVATGVSAGTATITYTLPTGCATTLIFAVNSSPHAISGPMNMCIGTSTTLSDATTGGTWSSAPGTGDVTISGTGLVTGISLGTAAVTYNVGGCVSTATVTVNSLPAAISGPAELCAGSAVILSDSSIGGSWSSGSIGIARVADSTGVVTGASAGIAAITYSLGAGCNAITEITVDPRPAAPLVSGGVSHICAGDPVLVTDVTAGGTWNCNPPAVATITGSGEFLGTGAGVAIISYTVATGCMATTMLSVTAVPSIIAPSHICAFGDTTYVFDTVPGGMWSSTLAIVVPRGMDTGLVTSFGSGIATITYTLGACFTTTAMTINPVPAPIHGITGFCLGNTTSLTDTTTGGVWSPASAGIATVSSTGLVTGLSAGITAISYTLPTGCMATATVTVDPHPSPIIGSANICPGATTALSDTAAGGTWSSTGGGIVTVNPATGVATAVSSGVATISYSFSPGCATARTVTVNPLPAAYTLTGGGNYCSGTGGVHIGLGGSDAGITYKLYHGAVLADTVTGTGSAADFGLETLAGTYTAIATNTATACSTNMRDSVTVTITPSVIPSVSIAASPGDSVCAGTPVTFTATALNGGGGPSYQWAVNSTLITGSGTATYSYTPLDNDIVSATLTSNATCAIPATAADSITMTVVTPLATTVTINATPGTNIKPGASVTLSAAVTGGGASPAYQWEIDGHPVAGATTATFTNTYTTADTVTCLVSASGICNASGSGFVIIMVSNVGVAASPGLFEGAVSVMPNPNTGEFIIKGSLGTNSDEEVSLEITDRLGQVVYRNNIMATNGNLNERILLSNPLAGPRMTIANGMYLLTLRSSAGSKVFHIVVER